MYTQELQYKIFTEVKNNLPQFYIGIRFNDLFTKDTYSFISEMKIKDLNQVPVNVFLNNKSIGVYNLENQNFSKLFTESLSQISDHDFHKKFTPEIKTVIQHQIREYFENYEDQLLLKEVDITGELKRMKEIAGITPKYLA